MLEDLVDFIFERIEGLGRFIKSIFLRIVSFVKNIASFFKDPRRLRELEENKDLIAVTIKKNYEDGNYTVVSCLFDKEKDEVVAEREGEDIQVVEGEELDDKLSDAFGDKNMIVVK